MATGDFYNDGFEDLAMGAPIEPGVDFGLLQHWGAIQILLGSTEASDSPYFGRIARQFGMQLAAGGFDNNGGDDLAVYHFSDLGEPLKRGFVSVICSKTGVIDINGFEPDPD